MIVKKVYILRKYLVVYYMHWLVAIPCSMLTIVERLERRIRNIEDTDAESEYIY